MTVEIIASGSELVRGSSVDTNSAWLSAELGRLGLETIRHTTVGDDCAAVAGAVRHACLRAEVVLLTGGLGPTEDDLARDAAARALGRPLEYRPEEYARIRKRLKRFRSRIAKTNRRQAYFPRGAEVIRNPVGVAAGFAVREGRVLFCALPGVPREMKPMFLGGVAPLLPKGRDFGEFEIRTFGLPEVAVDEIVSPIVESYGVTVRHFRVSIVVRLDGPRRKERWRKLRDRLKRKLGRAYLGEGKVEIWDAVAALLKKRRATIAVAESCTGGLVTSRLVDVPGMSKYLLDGVVTYSNGSKITRLGVPEELIRKHGAVSGQVARAMAEGVARTSGAKIGVATTGIAGPAGGTKKKPVGLVYVAAAYRGKTEVRSRRIPGDRGQVRERTAGMALDLVRRVLE
ncbi:MAG: competence/damage-inducible protein A [Planctomycetota bacterium]|jgi:nicotinamide-nucleotide amidase